MLGKRQLVTAPPEQCFWVWNGPILKDLRELKNALKTISEEQFEHHVTREKNDFEKWVREVLRDEKCAKALSKSRLRGSVLKVVEEALKAYQ